MELRIKREQTTSGMFGNKVSFVIRARGLLTQEEAANIRKYGIGGEVIYNSEAARKHLQNTANARNNITALISLARAKMSLNITIDSLTQEGHTITCSNLDEAIGAEDALKEACEAAATYIKVASAFDGSEEIFAY